MRKSELVQLGPVKVSSNEAMAMLAAVKADAAQAKTSEDREDLDSLHEWLEGQVSSQSD